MAKKLRQPDKKITIGDIARLAESSEATVSRVLNNKDNVSPATRKAVLQAVQQLGYVHTPRNSIDSNTINSIGLCFGLNHDGDRLGLVNAGNYFAEITESLQAECQAQNINLMLLTIGPDGDEIDDLRRVIDNKSIDSILLLRVLNPNLAERIIDFDIPCVLTGSYFPWLPIDSINSDAFTGMLTAMQYLIDNGHRQIAYIDGYPPPYNDYWVTTRKLAYLHALEQNNIQYDDELVAYGYLAIDTGKTAMEQILSVGKPFTAVLAANDRSAIGAVQALNDANLHIPHDVSIIGHDNVRILSIVTPQLTTVNVAMHEMGQLALETLQMRKQSPDQPIRHILTAECVIPADSVRNLNGDTLRPVNSRILPYRR